MYDELARVDVVLHAGDVVTRALLDELSGFAPVHAVLGNNDHDLVGVLPETLTLDLDGVRVAMIHDAGPARGARRVFTAGSQMPYSLSSDTAISRSTSWASEHNVCSILGHRPNVAGLPTTPSGD